MGKQACSGELAIPPQALWRHLFTCADVTAKFGRRPFSVQTGETADEAVEQSRAAVECWGDLIEAWKDAMAWSDAGGRTDEGLAIQRIEDACAMDTRISFAREVQRLFSDLVAGKATEDNVALRLAKLRRSQGDNADLLGSFFSMAMSTYRIVPSGAVPNRLLSDDVDSYIQRGSGYEVPTRDERALFSRAERLLPAVDAPACLRLLLAEYSAEATLLRKRANRAELKIPAYTGVSVIYAPWDHDWMSVSDAVRTLILAGIPFHKERKFRVEWAKRAVFLCVAVTCADISWQQLGLTEGGTPKAWIWQTVARDKDRRAAFLGIISVACDELERLSDAREEQGTAQSAVKVGSPGKSRPHPAWTDASPNACNEPWLDEGDAISLQDADGEAARVSKNVVAYRVLLTLKLTAAVRALPMSEFVPHANRALAYEERTAALPGSQLLDTGGSDDDPAHVKAVQESHRFSGGGLRDGRGRPFPLYDEHSPKRSLDKMLNCLRSAMSGGGKRARAWRARWVHVDQDAQTIHFKRM